MGCQLSNSISYMKNAFIVLMLIATSCNDNGRLSMKSRVDVLSNILKISVTTAFEKSYLVSKTSSFKLLVESKEQVYENSTSFAVVHTFTNDTSGNLQLATSYQKIQIESNQDGEKESVSVSKGVKAEDTESAVWSLFLETKPYVIWNAKGEVIKSGGLDILADSIFANMNVDPTTKLALRKKWEAAIRDMQQSLSQNLFPGFVQDSLLAKGSSWTVKLNDKALEIPVALETVFTLDSWDAQYANLSSAAQFNINNAVSNQVPGSKVQLQGEQKGEYKIDLSTGLVASSTIKTQAKGSFQMMGKEFPVTVVNQVSVVEQR